MYCHLCDESFDFGEHYTWTWYNKLRKVFTEDYYFILTYALYTCKRGSYVSTKEAFIEKLDPRVKFSFAIYLTGKLLSQMLLETLSFPITWRTGLLHVQDT